MAESSTFVRGDIEAFLGTHEKASEVAGAAWTPFTDLATSIKGASLALQATSAFRNARRAKCFADRFPNLELADLAPASARDLV
jgi:hypothetical protein